MPAIGPGRIAAIEAHWAQHAESAYRQVTDNLREHRRLSDVVLEAAEHANGMLPTRADMDEERERPHVAKHGREIEQGLFVARVLGDPTHGAHLMEAMRRPTAQALTLLDDFQRTGTIDLGPARVDRNGIAGEVTLQNHAFLNAEDDLSTAAVETAVDLVLLDPSVQVGIVRGGPTTHPRHTGRRIFGSGINLTHLYEGKISLIDFMLVREFGYINKMYRGITGEHAVEKPWIAAVESHAIGGACQLLLVMDYVVAESGAYFSLPARKDGIIPGCAALRLPRFVGERLTRQAIFFNHVFQAAQPDGRLLADAVGSSQDMDTAIDRAVTDLTDAGAAALTANRSVLRNALEPLDDFRAYMSDYARAQAFCLHSPALIANLERLWLRRSPA